MGVRFLFDEHLRGRLLQAVGRHNRTGGPPLDAIEVGGPPDLPRGTGDPAVLVWAETNGYVVVTRDRQTMIGHLADHLAAGRHSPGVMILPRRFAVQPVIDYLVIATYAGDPTDFADRVTFIP